MIQRSVVAVIVALSIATSLAVSADDKAIEKAVGYRQGAYKIVGWHFGPMAAMVKGEIDYDADVFAANADALAAASQFPINGFTPGSSMDEASVDTDAKAEIWANREDFETKMANWQEQAAKLADVAKSGDFDQIKAQFVETGKACKACHDDYRHKD